MHFGSHHTLQVYIFRLKFSRNKNGGIKHLVTENHEFVNRHESILIGTLWSFRIISFLNPLISKSKFFNGKHSIKTLLMKFKPVLELCI